MKNFINHKQIIGVFLLLFLIVSCSSSKSNYEYTNSKESLRKLMFDFKNAKDSGNNSKASELIQSFIVDKSSIKKALKDGTDPKTINKLNQFSVILAKQRKKLGDKKKFDKELVKQFRIKKEYNEVLVHEATTEEIAKNDEKTIVWKEFPGGAVAAAKKGILRPKMKFYEVEFVKKGESRGMKYHLFFWNGSQWKMLGKVWRALR